MQQANSNIPIDRMIGEYAFLSNFHDHTFHLRMCDAMPHCLFKNDTQIEIYHSAEAAYQAGKFLNYCSRGKFIDCLNPVQAKRMGKGKSWDGFFDVNVAFMKNVLRAKFGCSPSLTRKLLETETRPLISYHKYPDLFWGMNADNSEGENMLGRLLMEVRKEIREKANE